MIVYYSQSSGYVADRGWEKNLGGDIQPIFPVSNTHSLSLNIRKYPRFINARPIISERFIKCAVYAFWEQSLKHVRESDEFCLLSPKTQYCHSSRRNCFSCIASGRYVWPELLNDR